MKTRCIWSLLQESQELCWGPPLRSERQDIKTCAKTIPYEPQSKGVRGLNAPKDLDSRQSSFFFFFLEEIKVQQRIHLWNIAKF